MFLQQLATKHEEKGGLDPALTPLIPIQRGEPDLLAFEGDEEIMARRRTQQPAAISGCGSSGQREAEAMSG